ncbi:hypothetical protein [Dactylosporangium sp. CA-139066]|uniref:hypothetical protein n=1 Tax=Dactylosporangium sp. CA-139066 TaxID=3239930 RepID=UPI003D9318BE
MKLKHNVPARAFRSDPITPEYQAEVDRSTNKLMLDYERAQRRLRSAEERLERAEAKTAARAAKKKEAAAREHEARVAAELVELRREELQRIEALMKSAPASAQHRGTRSFRPIPAPGRQV